MKSRTAAVPFVLVTMLLDVLGLGLIIPVMPKLIASVGGGDPGESSGTFGLFIAVYGLMQFLCAPLLGALSDTYGRRPIILLSVLGAGLDYALMAVAPSMGWLFVGRIIAGITGANFTAIHAYIADVTPAEKRAASFGMLGAVFGVGFILGPAMGGVLGSMGLRIPFMAAAGLNLVSAAYGFFVLPESLPSSLRKPLGFKSAIPFASLSILARHPVVMGLMVTVVLFGLAQHGMYSTWVLFTTRRHGWTELDNGLSLALSGVAAAVIQGGLVGKIVGRLGERRALLLGMVVTMLTYVGFGLAPTSGALLVVLVLGALGGISGPSAQALISRQVGPGEQGSVQGAVAGLQSLTGVVAPVVFTRIFGAFSGPGVASEEVGMAFYVGALCVLVGIVAAVRSFKVTRAPVSVVETAVQPA